MLGLIRAVRTLERLLPPCSTAAAAVSAAAVLGGATAPRPTPAWQQPTLQWRSHTSSSSSSSGSSGGPAAAFSSYDQQHQQHQQQPEDGDSEQFAEQRRQLLAAALPHVQRLGWSGGAAAAAAAADLGLSPAAAGMLGSDAELVQLFFEACNRQLEAQLAGMQPELEGMEVRERIRTGLQLRLRMLEPHIANWPSALSLLAQPGAAPRTLALYASLADAVWHAAGDTSADYRWYTRRALLSAAYAATELYMLSDCSPGFADTWAALDRRLGEALALEQAAGQAGSMAGAAGGAAGAVLEQLSGVLRRSG